MVLETDNTSTEKGGMQMNLSSTHIFLAFASGLCALLAHGANIEFPSAGGDLASAAEWGGTLPPVNSDTAYIKNNGTYRATGDATFFQFSIYANDVLFDLSQDGNKRITLNDNSANAFTVVRGNVKHTFKGGEWFFANKGTFSIGSARNYSNNSTVLDGACVTNVGTVYLGYSNGHGNTLTLTNNATLHAQTVYLANTVSDTGANRMVVRAGCRVNTSSTYMDIYGNRNATSGRHELTVCGTDAEFTASSIFQMGSRHDGNTVRILDGAVFRSGNLSFGSDLDANGTPKLGGSSIETSEHAFFVGSGASAIISTARIGNSSARNECVVSNGSFTFHSFAIGYETSASNNVFRVIGPDAEFLFDGTGFWEMTFDDNGIACRGPFGRGNGGLFEFSSGATNNYPGTRTYFGHLSGRNTLRVTEGSAWLAPSMQMYLGYKDAKGVGNRLEVGAGSVFSTSRFHSCVQDNSVVLSNGTFQCHVNSLTAFCLGFIPEGTSAVTTGNSLRFEGGSPKLRFAEAMGGMQICNGSRLEFAVPAIPYVEPPIVTYQIDMDDTSDIFIDTTAPDATRHRRLRYVLARVAANGNLLSEAALARAKARLAPAGKLVWEGTDLVLTLDGNKSMTIILR